MSRSARRALQAQLEFDFDTRIALSEPLLSQPVEVELMELVVGKDRTKDRYSRLDRATGIEDDRRSGLKNFKRFRKVRKNRTVCVCVCVCVCYSACAYVYCYSYALSLCVHCMIKVTGMLPC